MTEWFCSDRVQWESHSSEYETNTGKSAATVHSRSVGRNSDRTGLWKWTKLLSMNNFSTGYKLHYTIFLTDCKICQQLVDFLLKHSNQNNLCEQQNLCNVICEKGSFRNIIDINGFNHKIFPKSEGLYALDEQNILSVSEKFLDIFCCNNNTSAIYCETLGLFSIKLQQMAKFHQCTINSCWTVTCLVN